MYKSIRKITAGLLAGAMLLGAVGCGKKETAEGFSPRLDTGAKLQLEVLGYFGNFEALDQVTNDFNQYYPNITFNYQQVGGEKEEEYMDANPGVDIIMTSNEVLHGKNSTFAERCVNLSEEDISFADIDSQMLKDTCIDGKQLAIPMGQNIYGIVVNTTLLEKEGLSVPENQEEFLQALSALKEKGYTPLQGPTSKIYAELTGNMIYAGLCEGQPLEKAMKDGNTEAATAYIQPAMDLVSTLMENGYTDAEVNASYPEDNYDEAILRFFEGDVPFWVCNTEKVSGMKKRESKSEAFQKTPFSYTFIYPPVGENGQYVYHEPWFGFAVNKEATNRDYALEFLRFLATKDEINKMADIKGIPSVAKESTEPEIYAHVLDAEAVKDGCINTGEVMPEMVTDWYTCTAGYAAGDYASAKEAAEAFVAALENDMQ